MPEKKKPIYKLKESRLQQGEARIRYWFAIPEAGTPYKELFSPVYWDVHGWKFQPGDMIRVEPDEGHYTADLRVLSTGAGGTRVAEYYKKEWDADAAPDVLSDTYEVAWGGPHHKWRVMRKTDGQVESHGFEDEAAANRWLADNLKALVAGAAQQAA